MTYDQIDRMVRRANPVDPASLERIDASVLDEQWRMKMQTHDRISIEQEPEQPRRGVLVGVAAAVIVVAGALILFQTGQDGPVADEGAAAVQIAEAVVNAYEQNDAERVVALLSPTVVNQLEGSEEGLRSVFNWGAAAGFRHLLGSCRVLESLASGTVVDCPYAYHALRSEEMGLGPYEGSWFRFTIADGEIVAASAGIEFMNNGFSRQVWEPFADWVSAAHPDDADVMYIDSTRTDYSTSEESIDLWERHTAAFVMEALRRAEAAATAKTFADAYEAGDIEQARALLAADAEIDLGPADDPEALSPLHAWNRAWGRSTAYEGCALTNNPISAEDQTVVRCTGQELSEVREALGVGQVTSCIDLTLVGGAITAVDDAGCPMAPDVWDAFTEWLRETHPGSVGAMLSPSGEEPLLTPESIALWDQYTEEFLAEHS